MSLPQPGMQRAGIRNGGSDNKRLRTRTAMRLAPSKRILSLGGLVLALAAVAAPTLNGFDIGNATVAIDQGGPPRDGIPALDRPVFESATTAALRPADRVLGIEIGGLARAYPVRILNWHEVVNDRFGQRHVVVTYCPLCGTGMAFEPQAHSGRADFGVSGLLHNSDMLLYDRATESLWSQILGTAISGPRKGSTLAPVALVHTSWADWRRRHPHTQVLSMQTGHTRDYGRDPYAGYATSARLMFDVAHRDPRLEPKDWVLGLQVDGRHKAYPLKVLDRAVGPRGEIVDRIGAQTLRVRYDREHATAEAFDSQGRRLPATMAFWFAWVAFHPGTEVLSTP